MRDHHRGHISKPTRRLALAVALVAALVLPGTAAAKPFVPKGLLELAGVHPKQTIQVIVVATPGTSTDTLKNELLKDEKGNQFGAVRREFEVVPALVVEMQAKHLPRLATRHGILSITPDGQVREQAAWAPLELWPLAVRADALWPTGSTSPRPPAIAVVDSGIHDGLADFGDRVVARENVTFARGEAPDTRSLVVAARGEPLAVGGERERVDLLLVAADPCRTPVSRRPRGGSPSAPSTARAAPARPT